MELEVEKLLKEKGITYRLIPLSGQAVTHQDVLKYAKGADPENDCKTLLVKDLSENLYGLFLLGSMRVDFNKVKGVIGQKVSIVSTEELQKITGKEPGAICPLLLSGIRLFIDRKVLDKVRIHFGSGDLKYGLEISPQDLRNLTNNTVVDIALPNN